MPPFRCAAIEGTSIYTIYIYNIYTYGITTLVKAGNTGGCLMLEDLQIENILNVV